MHDDNDNDDNSINDSTSSVRVCMCVCVRACLLMMMTMMSSTLPSSLGSAHVRGRIGDTLDELARGVVVMFLF